MKTPQKYLPVLLMALLLGSVQKLYAQKIGTFQHVYGTKTVLIFASAVVALPDKGFLTGGVNENGYPYGVREILIIRTDSLGREIWAKTYTGSGNSGNTTAGELTYGVDMVLTPEGNVVVCSNTNDQTAVYLFKINLKGTLLWSKTFAVVKLLYYSTYGTCIINAVGGGYILTGTSSSSSTQSAKVTVIKTDTAGNVTWSKIYYATSFKGCGLRIVPSRGGGYLISGVSQDSAYNYNSGSPGNYLVMKIDNNGKLLWSKILSNGTSTTSSTANEAGYSIIELPDKSIYVSGTGQGPKIPANIDYYYAASLMKLDSTGKVLWSKRYNDTANITDIEFRSAIYDSVNKTINISCAFVNKLSPLGITSLCGVTRLDTSGKVIFSKYFGPKLYAPEGFSYSGSGHNLLQLSSGDFAMLVTVFDPYIGLYDNLYFIKMDSGANSNNCNTSLFSISASPYPLNYLYSYKDTSVTLKVDSGCTVANATLIDSMFCAPFIADFGWVNPCSPQKTQFLDSSYAGAINWKWDFGDTTSSDIGALYSDTSRLKNPVHIYAKPGTYTVKLISSNSNDTDSLSKTITIYQSPAQTKYFDTLICNGTAIKLLATGGATYLWQPYKLVIDSALDTPTTAPPKTTNFVVAAMATNGCTVHDTVHVTVDSKPDTPKIIYTTVKNNKEIDLSFQKSDSNDVKTYLIYRSANSGAYQKLVAIQNLSDTNKIYFYADTAVNSDSNNYSYKVVAFDSCGANSDSSLAHTPVLLKGKGGELRDLLKWTKYLGYAYDTAIVQRYDTITNKWINLAYLNDTDSSYTDSSYLRCNSLMDYRIATLLKNGKISYSDSVIAIPYETVFKDTPQMVTVTKTVTSTTNGTVVIRWLRHNNRVVYNQLYYSTDGINFSLLQDSIPVSQDSFVHSGINTQSADQYYYQIAVDSCPAKSFKSVIHKTMTLTVSIGELLHKLNWTPYSGFNVKTYYIQKLIGSDFQNIDSLTDGDTATKYFPAPCNYVERYRIEAVGFNPGEISFSDSMGRKALDTIPPDAPVIQNATVVNDSTAMVVFKSSVSPDTYNFIVQRSTDGNWGTAGSVLSTDPGQQISYIDSNVNTVINQLCYTVIARDSCLNVTASDTFCLMQLKGDPENLSDSLKWSAFKGYNINNYAVLRFASPNNWDTVGTVSGTDTQYLDMPLPCRVQQTYKILGIENGGVDTTLSNSITLMPFDTINPPAPEIKYATVLSGSQIELFWHKTVPKVKLYELSLKTGTGNFKVEDTINIDTSFIFNGLNTVDSVYDFRVVAIDSCAANRSPYSTIHSPVFLSGDSLDDTIKLTWKPYRGFTSVKEYYIYQLVNNLWSVVDSVSGNDTEYFSKTLPCNVPQAYRVGALDNTGEYLSFSDSITRTPFDTIKPPAPLLYYATVLPNQTVKLSWSRALGIKYFEIWRSENGGTSSLIDTVIADSVFIDTNADVKNNIYAYNIIAIDSCSMANRSKPSQTDSLMNLKLYSLYCKPQVQVRWSEFSGLPNGVMDYNIWRSMDGVNFAEVGSVNAYALTFIDTGVVAGQQYFYKTEAVDPKSGYTSYSDTLSITPRIIPDADSAQLVYATVLKSSETNGQIYIQWKRAAQNDTNARGYYLYSYNSTNGKYALLQDITDLNDTTYINSNINTLEDIFKYYVITYNVCDVGINSNVHRTVLLMVKNGNLKEDLNWINYLGVPVKSYTVYKSIDGGVQFAVVNAGVDTAYSDSNITCNHKVTYQIQAILANGEISLSDSVTIKTYDTISPVTKPIVVATVTKTGTANGMISLSWNAATDNNLMGYDVYRSNDGVGWILLKQNETATSLTDTGLNTYIQSYYYKIQPVDSCGNYGAFTTYHETMNLNASSGNGYNLLSWNGYAGWPVRKYLIYRNGSLLDTVANNAFSFKDTQIICRITYQYLIKAIDSLNDTIVSASNTDSAKAQNHIPPQKVYIKDVTVSNPNKAVTISWIPSHSYDVKDYLVYKKKFETGDLKFLDSTFNTTYIDSSEQVTEPDCYYVFARDHCDNLSDGSNEGCTIILNAQNQPGKNQLSWNSYQNWPDGIQSYNVYKEEDSSGWQLIGTTSSPLPGNGTKAEAFTDGKLGDSVISFCYQVEAVENPGQYNQLSRSTVACVHQDATVFIPNTFTPYNQDGLNDYFGPKGLYIKSYSMKIYNRWGEMVYSEQIPLPPLKGGITPNPSGWDGTYKGQPVQQGIYIYLITVTDYNGHQSYFKGTVTMFE